MKDENPEDTVSDPARMPIYLDEAVRPLFDLHAANELQPDEWFPSNGPAQKLHRIATSMSDLEDSIESYFATSTPKKRRIRLRAMTVPLHSLCVGLVDTINAVQSEQEVHSRLPKNCMKQLTTLRSWFVDRVPFDRKGKLGKLRNKVGAHMDDSLDPAELRALAATADSTEVGEWIHVCLSVACDLLKLDAYSWAASAKNEDQVILMWQEPFMAVMRIQNNHVVGLDGVLMSPRSPKQDVLERIASLCDSSQKLFTREAKWRISGFFHDEPGQCWASSLRMTGGRGEPLPSESP